MGILKSQKLCEYGRGSTILLLPLFPLQYHNNFYLLHNRINFLPLSRLATPVEPAPINKSSTTSPALLEFVTSIPIKEIGFSVGCFLLPKMLGILNIFFVPSVYNVFCTAFT